MSTPWCIELQKDIGMLVDECGKVGIIQINNLRVCQYNGEQYQNETFKYHCFINTQDIILTIFNLVINNHSSQPFNQFETNNKIIKNIHMYADDNDQYSEDQHSRDNRVKIKPLHLTQKELQERLLTLKNYNIWKKTKAKRINYKELQGDQSSPIIHTAASYGSRYGKNQVFIQFVQQNQSQNNTSVSQIKKNFDVQAAIRESRTIPKQKPSFINYKTDDKQKQKIYRMINRIPKLSAGELSVRKKRSNTQPRLNRQDERTAPYPRELAKLKDKLRILPSLVNRKKVNEVQVNPEQQNVTLSLGSKQQSQAINIGTPFKYSSKLSHNNNSFMYSDNSRSSYLKNIHSILSKSSELLNGTSSESELIRVSNSSYKSGAVDKKSQSQYFRPENKQKYLYYWPKYSKYGVSQADQSKMQRILKRCKQINTQTIIQNQDIKQMTTIIKQQIGNQQQQMDDEVLQEQKNAFQHKFDYKINLQQENYKKNMKELMRCKKEYRIEKQREEIRANGIKRMKKFREIDTRKFKVIEDQQQEEDY